MNLWGAGLRDLGRELHADRRLVIDGGVRSSGKSLPSTPEPARLRVFEDNVRRDRSGRAVLTIRIEALNGMMRLHLRGKTWQVPFADNAARARITLDRASLTGYERTSLESSIEERSASGN